MIRLAYPRSLLRSGLRPSCGGQALYTAQTCDAIRAKFPAMIALTSVSR